MEDGVASASLDIHLFLSLSWIIILIIMILLTVSSIKNLQSLSLIKLIRVLLSVLHVEFRLHLDILLKWLD